MKRVQFIRHATQAANAFVGRLGEITVDLTTKGLRLHDGATPGGSPILSDEGNEAKFQGKNGILTNLTNIIGVGYVVRRGSEFVTRTFTAGANIAFTNADGEAGNTQISVTGLGALAAKNSVNNADWSGTDLAVEHGGTGVSSVAGIKNLLDLAALAYKSIVGTSDISDDAVTNAELANMAAHTVKVRVGTSAGDPSDLAIGTNSFLGRIAGNLQSIGISTSFAFASNLLTLVAASTTILGGVIKGTQAQGRAGTADRYLDAATLAVMMYESSELDWSNGTTINHTAIGFDFKRFEIVGVAQTSGLSGINEGDEVSIPWVAFTVNNTRGVRGKKRGNNLRIQLGANGIYVDTPSGTLQEATNTQIKLKVRAWPW
jgi:hypothetical protein